MKNKPIVMEHYHKVHTTNVVEELKAKYGRDLCFCGGFNNVEILDREDQ